MLALLPAGLILPGCSSPQPRALLLEEESGVIAGIVSAGEVPSHSKVHQLPGVVISPGLIDPHTHLGLLETGGGEMGDDSNETIKPVAPELRALEGVFYRDPAFDLALSGGLTSVGVLPGPHCVVGGQAAALRTWGESPATMVLNPYAGMKCAVGEQPRHQAPGTTRTPQTKMVVMALLRGALQEGRLQLERGRTAAQRRDLGAEAWAPVLERRVPLRVHVHRAGEIDLLLQLAREFDLRLALEHGTEAGQLAGELATAGVAVVCNPYFRSPGRREEMEPDPQMPGVLARAGVTVALCTNHPERPVNSLRQAAGLALRHGMTWEQAMDSVTINPARILGVDHRLGSLAEGKEADMVLWNGDPLCWRSRPLGVLVRGRLVWGELGVPG